MESLDEMREELESLDPLGVVFIFRILTILKKSKFIKDLTYQEVYDLYISSSPPNKFKDAIKNVFRKEPSITHQKLDAYLKILTKYDFIVQDVRPWRNEPLSDVKMIVYIILKKGEDFLHLKDKKKR